MKQLWLAVAISLGAASCADDSSPIADEELEPSGESEELGSLSLNLTGVDSQGRQYRLRNAEFYVGSYYYDWRPYYDAGTGAVQVLSTELDPDAATLTTRLVPGNYNVSIQGNWYLERLTATGPERVERAVLLSEPVQYTYIYHGGVAYLVFRFGVDGDLIDFRHGDLVIGTEIELPGESNYDAGPRWDAGGGWLEPGWPSVDGGVVFN